MAISDPIADMLTRIRNAVRNRSKTVTCLNTKVCRGILDVLKSEGYIDLYDVVEDGRQGLLKVKLRFGPSGSPVLRRLHRESKPGCRVYCRAEEAPSPQQGLGISIVSTSRGVKSNRSCVSEKVGGELLCTVE